MQKLVFQECSLACHVWRVKDRVYALRWQFQKIIGFSSPIASLDASLGRRVLSQHATSSLADTESDFCGSTLKARMPNRLVYAPNAHFHGLQWARVALSSLSQAPARASYKTLMIIFCNTFYATVLH